MGEDRASLEAKALSSMRLARRAVLSAALACVACNRSTVGLSGGSPAPLKGATKLPIGCAVTIAQVNDPVYRQLLLRNFSQITPDFQMKMNLIVRKDGRLGFEMADMIAAFAATHRLRLHATTLVWYRHVPDAFKRLMGDKAAFGRAYDEYIRTVVGRYKGQAVGWDVVNEPIEHTGSALRPSEWSQVLGAEDYMVRAFEMAADADPNTVHFLNEYGLESRPDKRLAFLRLVERLLRRGAKIGGLGTQTHINIDQPRPALLETFKELAAFGLPIHVSELDISFGRKPADLRSVETRRQLQKDRARDVVEAFQSIPSKQRYALTLWGLRDGDSWLVQPPYDGSDQPLAFTRDGEPKPMLDGLIEALSRKQ